LQGLSWLARSANKIQAIFFLAFLDQVLLFDKAKVAWEVFLAASAADIRFVYLSNKFLTRM
jgi:hypothetical protein